MMPSLRQRVSTYFRQLSFIAEPRERETQINDGSFITRYLEGIESLPTSKDACIFSAKEPSEMPNLSIGDYDTSLDLVVACTGPAEGLCGIKRNKLHLSAGPDIDFIDTIESAEDIRQFATSSSRSLYRGQRSNSGSRANDQNANQNSKAVRGNVSRKNSIVSVQDGKSTSKLTNQCTEGLDVDNLNKNIDKIQDVEPTLGGEDVKEVISSPIDGISNWKSTNENVYGIAISLYEKNILTNEYTGSPIADCYGVVARKNCAALALADGVNWGSLARTAARASVFGCLEYLDTAIFGKSSSGIATTTTEVFVSLLRSFSQAHACILENNGALSTLTVAVVLPLSEENTGKFVVCCCNVGDSLGYVYSKVYGVREFTQGSHNIEHRDMRDALGALGPVDGNNPELGNLTLSMTIVESGDIVFLTSDGISDNFDPVVGKFAEPLTEEHQRKLTKNLEPPATVSKRHVKPLTVVTPNRRAQQMQTPNSSLTEDIPIRPPRTKKVHSNATKSETPIITSRPKYSRSHTFIEPRRGRTPKSTPSSNIVRSEAGLPLVSGAQRHALSLLRLNDLFSNGINGTLRPCNTAKNLCLLLIDFVRILTTAKRRVLEQRENFYKIVTNEQGARKEVEMSKNQQRIARKKVVDGAIYSALPGKLDHASCCAFKVPTEDTINIPSLSVVPNYTETNF